MCINFVLVNKLAMVKLNYIKRFLINMYKLAT